MRDGRVVGGLQRRGHALHFLEEAAAPGAGLGGLVPVPAVGQVHALGGLQAERVHIVDEHQQAGQLHALGDAELVGGLDRVDGVATGIGQAEYLRARALGLQQKAGEVAGVERVLDAALDRAAGLGDDGLGVGLQGLAEGVVGGQEIPALATGLGDCRAGAVGQGHGVVGVVDGVGRAVGIGEGRAAGADCDEGLFLFGRDRGHGQVGAGVGAADQQVQALGVEPFTRLGRGDVGLVLMVGKDELDLLAGGHALQVGDGHLDGLDATGAIDVGVDAGHVGQETDLDDIARDLGLGSQAAAGEGGGDEGLLHGLSPGMMGFKR
mmetsp:Transcript_57663/g.135758  ORF Transcript_57663/g.135758 Transcript_57663/m.135758 type:complete len:322 (+) Transcript_57663:950-1915(+)